MYHLHLDFYCSLTFYLILCLIEWLSGWSLISSSLCSLLLLLRLLISPFIMSTCQSHLSLLLSCYRLVIFSLGPSGVVDRQRIRVTQLVKRSINKCNISENNMPQRISTLINEMEEFLILVLGWVQNNVNEEPPGILNLTLTHHCAHYYVLFQVLYTVYLSTRIQAEWRQ